MYKNGRPFTNENGYEDSGLISDLSYKEQMAVDEWIRKNIRKSRYVDEWHSSYGLKHILKSDTGIYLTNNEFKDAMLAAGYEPVDPGELNWSYKIEVIRDKIYNTNPFRAWVGKRYFKSDSPEGDFARDMLQDPKFPGLASYEYMKEYLVEHTFACQEALVAFEKLWKEYQRKIIQKRS